MKSTLLKKLRYRPGMRVFVTGAPSGFEKELDTLPDDVTRARSLRGKKLDLVQAFYTRKSQVLKDAAKLRDALEPGGILWLTYPKGKTLATDLNRDILRETVAPLGLEAVAIVAVDAQWSALRCKVV